MSAAPLLLTAQHQALLEPLRHGSPVSVDRLVSVLYAARWDGGPEDAPGTVRTLIYYLRGRLAPAGIAILTIGIGRGAQGYMVDPEHLASLDGALEAGRRHAIALARQRPSAAIEGCLMRAQPASPPRQTGADAQTEMRL